MSSFIREVAEAGLDGVQKFESGYPVVSVTMKTRFLTNLTRLLDVDFIPTIGKPIDENGFNAGAFVLGVSSIDQIYCQLIGQVDVEAHEDFVGFCKNIRVQHGSDQYPYIERTDGAKICPELRTTFGYCYAHLPKKKDKKPALCIDFKFNPTKEVLGGLRKRGTKEKYVMPRSAPTGASKENLFLPHCLALPAGFEFADEIRECLERFEGDLSSIADTFSFQASFRIRWNLNVVRVEYYRDYLTEDPISTYFRLASFVPQKDSLLVEAYNNRRQFLSVRSFNGHKKKCTEERYCGLTALPSASNTKDKICVVRYEIRKQLGRAGVSRSPEFPDFRSYASGENFNLRWMMTDYIRMAIAPLKLTDNQQCRLLSDGRRTLAMPTEDVLAGLCSNPAFGNIFDVKFFSRAAKPNKTGEVKEHPKMELVVSTRAYEVLYSSGIFSDLLIGKKSDRDVFAFKSLKKRWPEDFRREIKRKIGLKKKVS